MNQPTNRKKIWPDQSILYLKRSSERTFYRNDDIDIHITSFEAELSISMQPPRDWSYDEECEAPEENAFQCSSEGTWSFILNKINE